jgi:asparagine synthase (glutamine-hydrolysing)
MAAVLSDGRECVSGEISAPELGAYAAWVARPGTFAARHAAADPAAGLGLALAGECVGDWDRVPLGRGEHGARALLGAFHSEGPALIERLNGAFGGVLVDRTRREATLFNDRYSAERIYVHERPDGIYFSSQARALLAVFEQCRSLDDDAVAEYLALSCNLEGRTLFKGIRVLPGGSRWTARAGIVARHSWFSPAAWETQTVLSALAFDEELLHTLRRVLPRYVVDPERPGMSLTAGLDTRFIMACLPAVDVNRLVAYTFAGPQVDTRDVRLARDVADACGVSHTTLRLHDDFFGSYASWVDESVRATDGYAGATQAHEVYLNQQAAALSPVRLTGNFGSELLRGMVTLKWARPDQSLLDAELAAKIEGTKSILDAYGGAHPVTLAAFRDIPYGIFGVPAAARSRVTLRSPFYDNDVVALAYRAPLTAYQPEASFRVIAAAKPALARIPTDRGVLPGRGTVASVLAKAAASATFKLDYVHNEGMTGGFSPFNPLVDALGRAGWVGQHKFLHYARWYRGRLAAYVGDVVEAEARAGVPYWRPEALRRMYREHTTGRANHVRALSSILTFASIRRTLLAPAQRERKSLLTVRT